MIDEKKIEDAAKKLYSGIGDKVRILLKNSFKDGINWYLSNLLHIADEEEPTPSPKDEYGSVKNEDVIWLLAVTKENEVKMMYSTHEVEYEGDEEGYWIFHDKEGNEYNPFYGEVKKWLYIDDLMKGGKA